jgi:hypothetical protein
MFIVRITENTQISCELKKYSVFVMMELCGTSSDKCAEKG